MWLHNMGGTVRHGTGMVLAWYWHGTGMVLAWHRWHCMVMPSIVWKGTDGWYYQLVSMVWLDTSGSVMAPVVVVPSM